MLDDIWHGYKDAIDYRGKWASNFGTSFPIR